MSSTQKLRPARKFGPGYFIKEQLDDRAWIQEDLAEVLGITLKHVNKIVLDKQPITLEMAKMLGEVFETSPQYWLSLDANYRLWLETEKTEKEIQADLKGKIYERMPIRDMINKKWLPNFTTFKELHQSVLNFWNVTTLDFEAWDKKTLPLLARKSENFNQYRAAYTYTWYHKAFVTAESYKVLKYNKEALLALYNQINTYSFKENGINEFIKKLNEAGVIFFMLPHLQKTYLDGAAFYCGKNPVIVFTARYKRIDNFWFTVAHEIAHVLYHLDDKNTFFLDNFKEENINELEQEANEKACEKLLYKDIVAFLNTKINYLSQKDIIHCATALQIHPAIIIGKLAYDKTISYANQSLFNENVLDLIDAKYLINE